jgi:hypothetical protein
MKESPQSSRFPNNCYTQAAVERWFSDGELVLSDGLAAKSEGSVYTIPSIICCPELKEADEPSLTWFSSNAAYAPAVVTQFPDALLRSDPYAEFAASLPPSNLSRRGPVEENRKLSRTKRSSRTRQTVTIESRRCADCNKEFTRKHDLFRHVTTVHGKLKPFPCRFEPCSRSFPRKDARDVRIPTGRR